jgi:alginate O-acetyltransferase complex protein AlgI
LNFVVWGFFHGAFLVVERMGLGRWMASWWTPLRHLYLLLVVLVSWVFFRAATLPEAWSFLKAMAGLSGASGLEHPLALYVDSERLLALAIGLIGSTPILGAAKRWRERSSRRDVEVGASVIEVAALGSILTISAMLLAAGTYNPFIYFRF